MAGRKKKHVIVKNKSILTFFSSLVAVGKMEVKELGVFSIKSMKARRGFNPGNGKYEKFPAYKKLTFEPSPMFKEQLNTWKK